MRFAHGPAVALERDPEIWHLSSVGNLFWGVVPATHRTLLPWAWDAIHSHPGWKKDSQCQESAALQQNLSHPKKSRKRQRIRQKRPVPLEPNPSWLKRPPQERARESPGSRAGLRAKSRSLPARSRSTCMRKSLAWPIPIGKPGDTRAVLRKRIGTARREKSVARSRRQGGDSAGSDG